MAIRYLDLFTGIGGFTYGIHKAIQELCNEKEGIGEGVGNSQGRIEQLPELGLERLSCIGYSEIDEYASAVYKKHYPEHQNYGDITTIDANKLPDFDLLVGGFPCQSFSIAGKRRGFDDTRGTLFFDIARILKEKRPRNFILENVKGLLSHDNGNTFKTIIATLAELGYCVEWQVLNSKNYGVPQNRERVFIVGHLGGIPSRKVFPIREGSGTYLKEITSEVSDAQRIYESSGIAKTLKGLGGGLGAKTGLYATPRIRRLTPIECERLQGFPDNWTLNGRKYLCPIHISECECEEGIKIPMSDTQRYKMCGNAVTTNVVKEIIKRLYDNNHQ
jgi:DNA (cytosine-5)-methyltransferase 1